MTSRDGESDSDSSDDDLYSSSAGSDINFDDSLDSFSSDTDEDDDPNSQSSLETFSSQISNSEGPGFWSSELHPVSIAPFSEETGPSHDLTPNDNILSCFFFMVSEDFFESVSNETNRYAAQEFEKRGHRDADWFDTSPQEIKAYFGLMGTNQLPSVDMYRSQNKFLGNQGFKDTMSRSRFRRLTEYLHLNDNITQGPVGSPEYNWLHKIRPLIEMTRRNFPRYMKPGQCQSIDDGMIRYKGHYFPSSIHHANLSKEG